MNWTWSQPLALDRIDARGDEFRLTADAETRSLLAARFDLVAIDALSAILSVRRRRQGALIAVAGNLTAQVQQTCVVTLEPFAASVAEAIDLSFAPAAAVAAQEIDVSGLDDPEPLESDALDLGEIVAQALSLALDPYPRAPGIAFVDIIEDAGDAPEPERQVPSSFASLAKLKLGGGEA